MARRLGIRPAWLLAEIKAHRLPAVQVGDGYLVDPPTIVRILTERAQLEGGRHER